MRRLPQSTAYTIMLKVFLSSDHSTPATGKTVAIVISKAGGTFANPNAGASTMTEIAYGWYKFALATQDTDTLGDLLFHATSAGCDDAEDLAQVVSATTGGLTALPNVAAGANGGLPLGDASGRVTVGSIANGAIAAATFAANALDAVWSTATRLLTAGTNIVLAKGTGVTGFNDLDAAGVRGAAGLAAANLDTQLSDISGKTANLPSDPADASDIAAAFVSLAAHGDSAWATAAGFATPGDVPSAADNAAAVAAQTLNVNVVKVNSITVGGSGAAGDPWGPA